MTLYMRNGESYFPLDESLMEADKLPVGNYILKAKPDSGDIYFVKVDDFKPLARYYGDVLKMRTRIIDTFTDKPQTTGVLLVGEKGSGKTLLARELSIKLAEDDIPTIIISNVESFDFETLKKALQDIDQPCIFLFDEFEKEWSIRDGDKFNLDKLLTILDGCFSTKKRLVIFTANEMSRISRVFINRPSRIFYKKSFRGLDAGFVSDYCDDNLHNLENKPALVALTEQFEAFNFDMLQSIVEEMNRYNETVVEVLRLLNIDPYIGEYYDYEYVATRKEDGAVFKGISHCCNPIAQAVRLALDDGQPDSDYIDVICNINSLVKSNIKDGKFVYDTGEFDIILTKPPTLTFDFSKMLI